MSDFSETIGNPIVQTKTLATISEIYLEPGQEVKCRQSQRKEKDFKGNQLI